MIDENIIIELGRAIGPTAIVSIIALYAILEVIKMKRNGNGKNDKTYTLVKKLEENHITDLTDKICTLDEKTNTIMGLLIEIRTLLRNKT